MRGRGVWDLGHDPGRGDGFEGPGVDGGGDVAVGVVEVGTGRGGGELREVLRVQRGTDGAVGALGATAGGDGVRGCWVGALGGPGCGDGVRSRIGLGTAGGGDGGETVVHAAVDRGLPGAGDGGVGAVGAVVRVAVEAGGGGEAGVGGLGGGDGDGLSDRGVAVVVAVAVVGGDAISDAVSVAVAPTVDRYWIDAGNIVVPVVPVTIVVRKVAHSAAGSIAREGIRLPEAPPVVVRFLDEGWCSGYRAIGQSSASIRSCFARLGRNWNEWVLRTVLRSVGWMIVLMMRRCHEGHRGLLGHGNLA